MTPGKTDSASEALVALQAMERALREERHALERGDEAAIESAVKEKNAALALYQGSGIDPDKAVPEERDALHALAATCETLNRENGRLIHQMTARAQRALDVLRGQEREPRLYSGSGVTRQGTGRQSLGKA
jgi:flagellar biosynthesis/type III secretory pathway chaperone